MKPASAMSFALKKPGRSALVCACTGTDFAVEAAIATKAAERSRSRFVSIRTSPHQEWVWLSSLRAANQRPALDRAPARRQLLLSRQAHRCLRLHDRRGIPFPGQRLRLRAVEAHGQVEGSLRRRKPVGFHVLARTFVLEVKIERTVR